MIFRVPSGPPVVGIVGHDMVVQRPWGDWPVTAAARTYTTALAAAGMRTVLLPGAAACELLDRVDALVLTGGGDVDPARSGASGGRDVDPARDAAELSLVAAARAHAVPLLGICRGMQVLVVAAGGTLRDGVEHVRPVEGHVVRTAPGSLIHHLLGPGLRTTALHHQAVADPGPEWRATAWSEGVIEAVEPVTDGWAALGVQWHPELDGTSGRPGPRGGPLFDWLRDAAAGTPVRPARPPGHGCPTRHHGTGRRGSELDTPHPPPTNATEPAVRVERKVTGR